MSTHTRIKRLPSTAGTTSSTSMDVTDRSSRVVVLQVFSGPHLAQLEIDARDAKRGLWQDPKPIPLWVFRKRQRGLSVSRDEMSCFAIVPTPHEGVQLSSQSEPLELVTLPVAGNIRSGKYHLPHCSGYSQSNLKNRVELGNEAEAEAAGYRRTGNCL